MKNKFLTFMSIPFLASSAFAGGGGGLHFDHKISEVKKAACLSGSNRLTFSDITWDDPEEGEFESTNLVIERPGSPKQTFFVWAHSVLETLPRARALKLEKVAMQDRGANDAESYFDIEINFATGEGSLSISRFNSGTRRMESPYETMPLRGCTL